MKNLYHQKILLKSLIGGDLYTYCKRKIGQEEANVLKKVINNKTKEWFDNDEAKLRRDNRSKIQFAQALVLDKIILHWLKDYFLEVEGKKLILNGCDKVQTLVADKITSAPDFKVKGKKVYIEEITCYTGLIRETGALHLRCSKGKVLQKLAENNKVYLLVVDMPSQSYTLVPITKHTPMYPIKSLKQFGGKSGYGMDIGGNIYKPLKRSKGKIGA